MANHVSPNRISAESLAEERARVSGLVSDMIICWQSYLRSRGGDAEVAVWTLIAELDYLKERIDDGSYQRATDGEGLT